MGRVALYPPFSYVRYLANPTTPLYSAPPAPYGRRAAAPLPSFPRKRESGGSWGGKGLVFSVPFGIPAYAGMTVEAAEMTVTGRQ